MAERRGSLVASRDQPAKGALTGSDGATTLRRASSTTASAHSHSLIYHLGRSGSASAFASGAFAGCANSGEETGEIVEIPPQLL